MVTTTLIAAMCLAQVSGEARPQDAPLQGPAVRERPRTPALAQRDFEGRMRTPDLGPEEAALGMVKLSDDSRKRAEAVLMRRAAAVDRFVSANLVLLGELDTAGRGGRVLDVIAILQKAAPRLMPVLADGPLGERVAGVLAADEAERFRAALGGYWRIAVNERMRESYRRGERKRRWEIELAVRLEHFGKEIERSFNRQMQAGTLFLDYLLADLDVTEGQRRRFTELKIDMLERAGGRPGEAEQRNAGIAILAHLDQRRRAIVLKRLAGVAR